MPEEEDEALQPGKAGCLWAAQSLTLQTSFEEYSYEPIPGVVLWPSVGYAVLVDWAQVDLLPPRPAGQKCVAFV